MKRDKMRTIYAICIGLAIVGCDSASDLDQRARAALGPALKDSTDYQLRNVREGNGNSGQVICGEVNAKNSFGGFVGYKPFLVNGDDIITIDELYVTVKSYMDLNIIINDRVNNNKSLQYANHCLAGDEAMAVTAHADKITAEINDIVAMNSP